MIDPDPSEDHRKLTAFKSLMQDYYGLEWIFEERSDIVNYINVTISICGDWIVTLLYEKSMNLHLYIPPHSAHSPGMLTGLVSVKILRIHSYWVDKDYINLCIK